MRQTKKERKKEEEEEEEEKEYKPLTRSYYCKPNSTSEFPSEFWVIDQVQPR
jgi:hypothetical protein